MSDDETSGGIASVQAGDGGGTELAMFSFSAVWFAVLGFFVWKDPGALCMAVPCGLFGLLPLAAGLYGVRNRRRYGSARFVVTAEATPGGRLEGVVHVAQAIEPDAHVRATLICMRRVLGADSVDAVISRTVAFVEPPPSTGGATGRIPIRIDVPAGEPTDRKQGDGSIYWMLQLVNERGCRGLDVSFHVPVASGRS